MYRSKNNMRYHEQPLRFYCETEMSIEWKRSASKDHAPHPHHHHLKDLLTQESGQWNIFVFQMFSKEEFEEPWLMWLHEYFLDRSRVYRNAKLKPCKELGVPYEEVSTTQVVRGSVFCSNLKRTSIYIDEFLKQTK